MTPLDIAQKYWNISDFRGDQGKIIQAILDKKDVLAVQGTGFGKSLCFQVPALMQQGITMVISPLVALMDDQVAHLQAKGIWATALHRNLSADEVAHRLDLLHLHQYQLLYVSPEKLASSNFLKRLAVLPIIHLVVDEAHCISEWGHDFRPEYRAINQVRLLLKQKINISAFTATAPDWVKHDIATNLQLSDPLIFQGSILKDNLYIETHFCNLEYQKWLSTMNIIHDHFHFHPEQSMIIYALTRKETEQLASLITQLNPSINPEKTNDDGKQHCQNSWVKAYHAGLSPQDRTGIQQAFQNNLISCVVATTAFGMGVDKSNVRKVILFGAPPCPESLLQQIGRAGRDLLPAQAHILYSERDFLIHNRLHSKNSEIQDSLFLKRLQAVKNWLNNKNCRWQSLADYYNEKIDSCHNCENCKSGTIHSLKKVDQQVDFGSELSKIDKITQYFAQLFPQANPKIIPGLGKGLIS